MDADSHARVWPGTPRAAPSVLRGLAGALGLITHVAAVVGIQPNQWNVLTYAVEFRPDVPHRFASVAFVVLLTIVPVVCALVGSGRRCGRVRLDDALAGLWPLGLSLPLAVAVWFDTGWRFPFSLLHLCGAGWSLLLAFRSMNTGRTSSVPTPGFAVSSIKVPERVAAMAALISLVLLVAALTFIHTRLQINFFEHFMLGHADMGHFTEELKNALAGRGLRSDSFPNTRLGWHFTPLQYLLVPGYWLWPSPVFLMACSALFVHMTAFPIYWLARRLSASTATAWLFALAWLLHPSVSRLPYSGTYGFQWLYITLPLTVWWMGAALLGRWKTFFVLLVILLLCRETTAAMTLGVGLYLVIARGIRARGVATAVVSAVYGVVCVSWIIPYFSVSGEYERLQVFGALGSSFSEVFLSAITHPTAFWGRLVRYESIMFVCTLLATLAFLPARIWRMSLATLPALVLVLLLDNAEWLSIKFWYQVLVLPIWFVAAMTCGLPDQPESEDRGGRGERAQPWRFGLAVLLCCCWGHYLFGFSPIAKSYDLYAADARLHRTDPAFDAVETWRREIPRTATILATERLAAHFTDYRRIYTGGRPMPADYVIINPRDAWDASGLPQRMEAYRTDPSYRVYAERGGIVVFERLVAAHVAPED